MDGKKIREWSAGAKDEAKKALREAREALARAKETLGNRKLLGTMAAGALMGAMLCGEVGFGARPFASALLCAAGDGNAALIAGGAVGLAAGALLAGADAVPLLIAGGGVLLLRALLSESGNRFCEPQVTRLCLACVSALFVGIWKLIRGGVLFYDLFGLLLAVTLAPLFVTAYRFASDPQKRHTAWGEGGEAGVSMALVLAARHMVLYSFSVGTMLAVLLTLYVSKHGGTMRGAAAGCLYGLMLDPLTAPALGICGLLSGVLWTGGTTLACTAGMAGAVACGLYTGGFSSLVTFAPDAAAGMLLALTVLSVRALPPLFVFRAEKKMPELTAARASGIVTREEAQEQALCELAGSLRSLAQVIGQVGQRLEHPQTEELRCLCEGEFRRACEKCALAGRCWGREQLSANDALNKLVTALCRKGKLTRSDVPQWLEERCPMLDPILSGINTQNLRAVEEAVRRNRLGTAALDFEAASKLLFDACERSSAEAETNGELTARVQKTARVMGIPCGYLLVCGKRQKRVIAGGVDVGRMPFSPREIAGAFGRAIGCRLSEPEMDAEEDYVTMTLRTLPRFAVETAQALCPKDGEAMSGDSLTFFDCRDQSVCALLSDGMGSGRDAAFASRLTTVFLRPMLEAGCPANVLLGMLNSFLRSDSLECFSTVDLLRIDLLTGHAEFLKAGAAPSFVLRAGRLFKLSSHALPVGITEEMNAESISFDLEPGDLIVLFSDGIAHDLSDSLWLAELLSFSLPPLDAPSSLSLLAHQILLAAAEQNHRADDMTVGVVRVTDAEGGRG